MLDAMQQLMTGGAAFFDAAFLGELRACWDDTHPDLATAQDSAWQARLNEVEHKLIVERPVFYREVHLLRWFG